MPYTLRTALDRIVTVESGLSITSPETLSIKRVYKFTPHQSALVPDVPCFWHSATLVSEDRFNGQRKHLYIVRTQLWVGNPDHDRGADIAAAFLAKWMDAFDDDVTLAGACSSQTIRGGDPTVALLERGNLASMGLDLLMDIVMGPEAATLGP